MRSRPYAVGGFGGGSAFGFEQATTRAWRPVGHHSLLSKGRSKDLPPEKLHFNHFWGARTFGWGDAIPDELLAKTDEYRVAAELADAVRAFTDIRRRRLGSEAVQPPPASFLSS